MKKSYFLSLLFLLIFVGTNAQDVGCVRIIARTPLPICNPGQSTTLEAVPPPNLTPRLTTGYDVSQIPFNWRNITRDDVATNITTDDTWSELINMKGSKPENFYFCFFNRMYSQLLIGDNGTVTFNISGHPSSPPGAAYVPSSPSGFSFNTPIPSGAGYGPPYKNAIMMLQDLLISYYTPIPATTKIEYFTTGVFPCRAFVASWVEVPHYQCGFAQGKQTYQVVLYESTNVIEVHVKNRTVCGFNSGSGLLGIQNADGSIGITPPGRNTGRWTAEEEAWRFTPNGAEVPITYAWYQLDGDGNRILPAIATSQSVSVSPVVETNYEVEATIQTCNSLTPIVVKDRTTVKMNEAAGEKPLNITHCDTDTNASYFDFNSNTAVILDGLDPANFEVSYHETESSAETNDDLYADGTTTLNPTERKRTIWVRIYDGVNECAGVTSFDIGLLSCKIDITVCDTGNDGSEVVDLDDYVTNVDNSNVFDLLTPANYSLTYHSSAANAEDIGTAFPADGVTVTDGQQIFIRVQRIDNADDFFVKFFQFKLSKTPNVTISGTTAICENATTVITISGEPGSSVDYTDNSGPHTITIDASGEYLITTPPVVSGTTYTYTLVGASLTTDGFTCTETLTDAAVVTVGGLPTATFTTTSTTICENDVITVDVQGTSGTEVTYTDNTGTHTLILSSSTGTGTGSIVMPVPLVANSSYTYTLVKVSTTSTPPCEQALTDSVTINVSPNPTATITQIDSQVCDGNVSQVRFTGTPDAIVEYTLDGTTNFITIPTSGDIVLSEVLSPQGLHTYALVNASMPAPSTCSQAVTGTVDITVVGAPTASISTAIPTVCSGGNTVIDFTGTPNASVQFAINGNLQPAITLLPSTGAPTVGTYTYTSPALTADTSYQLISVSTTGTVPCSVDLSTTAPVLVTVKPLPTATIQANQNICTGTSTIVTVTATPNSNVSYTINGATPAINLPIGPGGTGVINTGILTADATYQLVSVSVLDGITCQRTLNATSVVRVVPLPTASFTALPNICSNRTAEITFTGTPNATVNFTYTAGGPAIPDSITLDGSGSFIYTTIPIVATTTFDLVSVVSVASGSIPSCTASIAGSLTITPVAAPIINRSVTPLEVCDDNTDGMFEFDLNSKKNEITFGNTGLVVTFYETYENSEDGYPHTAIDTSVNYPNRDDASPEFPRTYDIYVRVEEPGGSTCPSLTSFRLIVNRTPQAVSPEPIAICDDASADGFAVFPDLTVREVAMTVALYDADPRAALYSDVYAFEYYLTQPDAEAGLAAGRITSTVSFPNTVAYNQTIWIRVINTSNATRCYKVVPMQLIVRELPVVVPATQYSLCDDDTEDGIRAFDLEWYKTQITTQPGMSVKYYFDNAAVTSGTELSMTMVDGRLQYINQVPSVQTIIAIVTNESQDTKCSTRATVTLRVLQNPFITIPAVIPTECDDDGNGSAVFDLDALKNDIRAGADYTITFHETRENAIDNLFVYGQQVDGSGNPVLDGLGNPIPIPYPSLFNGNIWIRATDNVTGCYSVAPLQLIVNPVPTVPAGGVLPELVDCDVNEDQQMRLNLRAHAEANLLPQPIAGTYVITLHNSSTDAEAPSGALIPDTNYPSIDGQIVWVRIENTDSDCYSIASFKVVINPAKLFVPKQFSICDDALPNDGKALFPSATGVFGDLDSLMTGGLSGYDVIYYRNVADQNALRNPIDKTVPYENESIPFQNIQVTLIDQVTGCVSISRLTLRVEPLPNPNTSPADIEVCDNGVSKTDGIAENVDLTVNETYIRNGANPTTVAFYYYNDLALANADAAANAISNVGFTNALATPTNYSGPSGPIYVLMTTNPSATSPLAVKCSAMVQFELIVNPAPALGVSGVIKDFVACVIGSTGVNTFTLSDHNSTVIASGLTPSDYTFTYYDSQLNAEGGTATGLRPNSYTNGTNPEPIWVRVVNNTTGCVNVGTFNLVVDEAAVANPVSLTEPLLTTCDNDGTNDGSTEFDLTLFNTIILGTPAPANFTVHYYDDETEYLLDMAEGVTTTNSRAISDIANYVVTNTQDIIAVVINRTSTTGCPDEAKFTLTVNKLPKVTLADGFFCFDPVTNLPLNTFALTATVDPAAGNYTYEWTKDGAPYAVPDNTVNVIQVDEEGAYSVVVTNVTTGCVSEPSNSATVEPTSTAIATATVTGYFTDNATITVNVDSASLGDYMFQLDEGQWQTSNVFSPVATGEHIINIKDLNDGGCAAFDPITVTVINYPKYFTPNGDGIHDKWTIAGLGEEARIYIFDRYGKLIKQISSDPAGGWDGTMNGQPLPSTDYWFKVEYLENNVMKEFKAHFSLKR